MKLQGFVGATYTMDAMTFDKQRCVNMYPITSEVGTSKSVAALRSVPGYETKYTLGGGGIRGAITCGGGRCFVVSGSDFYELFEDFTTTDRGNLLTSTTRCSLAENGDQVIVVDGTTGYIFNLGANTFTEIADVNFPVCQNVTYQDGYFIVPEFGTNNFYISAINDGTSWDALDFSQAVSNPDPLVAVFSDTGNLWLFGERSTEVFANTGNANFPFERIPNAIIQTGCAAWATVQAFDNTIAWLGVDGQGRGVVWRANGYDAQRMSTQAIEAIIASADDFSESYAYTYHEQGHVFYCLQVKGLSTTLVYDGATGLWHERAFNSGSSDYEQHRGAVHFFFGQNNFIGDRINGKIYRQSLDLYSFDGDEIHRERTSPHYVEEKRNVPFSSFELDMETGKGLATGQGSDPVISLEYSDDGGRTWSNKLFRATGAIGNYKTRVRWSRLGSSRARVFRVRYSEPTFFQINEAYINGA